MPGKKVLVVDDEPAILEILTLGLHTAGFEVCSAASGEEAIEKAKREKPDMIIMDITMPKMSGFETMGKLRKDLATQDIPAILLSARSGAKNFFMEVEGVEFMDKPFDFKALIRSVRKLIAEAEQRNNRPA